MTAAQARAKAHSIKVEANKDQYEKVMKMITSAVSAGRFDLTYYDKLGPNVRQQLYTEGYTVKDVVTGLNEAGVEITW